MATFAGGLVHFTPSLKPFHSGTAAVLHGRRRAATVLGAVAGLIVGAAPAPLGHR